MKKGSITMMLAVIAMLTSLVLTSCGGEEGNEEPPVDTYSATIEYKLPLTDDMVNLFDITVAYYDASADKEVTEKVTKTDWTKKITAKTLPAKAYLKATLQEKAGASVKGETFSVARSYTMTLIRYKNNKEDGSYDMPWVSKMTIGADKYADFVAKYCTGTTAYVNSGTVIVKKTEFEY